MPIVIYIAIDYIVHGRWPKQKVKNTPKKQDWFRKVQPLFVNIIFMNFSLFQLLSMRKYNNKVLPVVVSSVKSSKNVWNGHAADIMRLIF